MKGTVLFIDTVHPALQYKLEQHNWKCTDGTEWNREKTFSEIGNFEGIVIRSRFKLDRELLQRARKLKFIARAGAGMENIDQPFAESLGIKCLNAPEGNRNAVAEHALGMLLALLNNIVVADGEVRKGKWFREENRGVEIDGKTVGIIGFGNTGSAFAGKLKGFDVSILACDPYKNIEASSYPDVVQTSMEAIHDTCDIVSFHVPLTDETMQMVNSDFLSKFKKPVYLLNTSRGKILKTADLVHALEGEKVKGAALDVLEFESVSFENLSADSVPESFHKLITMKNVILSPHIAGWTFESHRKISEVLAEKIISISE